MLLCDEVGCCARSHGHTVVCAEEYSPWSVHSIRLLLLLGGGGEGEGEGARLVTLSPCHLVTLSPCHLVTLSPCHLVTLSPCHLVTLSWCVCAGKQDVQVDLVRCAFT